MAQVFPPYFNNWSKASIVGAALVLAGMAGVGVLLATSSYVTGVDVVRDQPVPFSHEHHVRRLGLDCRYCHTSVETAAFAGIPPAKTCMNCHSQLFTESAMLAPIRESARLGKPVEWTRVHDLPQFVYFDHSIHVAKGVACVTCHGQVDRMPLMMQKASLSMSWCLDCHRNPEKFVGKPEDVFKTEGPVLFAEADQPARFASHDALALTNCSTCHR